MILRIISDLHLEFWRAECLADRQFNGYDERPDLFFVPEGKQEKETTLIIAGDLCESRQFDRNQFAKSVMTNLSNRFERIIYVMGNHDHYHGIFEHTVLELKQHLSDLPNVIVLDNERIDVGNIAIIGSTLWTDYDKEDPIKLRTAINNDFAGLIHHDYGEKFRTTDSVEEHKKSLEFIKKELTAASLDNKQAIVVTHHAPSLQSIHAKYRQPPNNYINCCFASDLDAVIEHYQPLYWIHGHVHDHFDYKIGNTKVIANPFGYPGENGNNGWKPLYLVKIL